MPTVRANGIDIHYRIDGQGPWLMLAHSLCTDLTMWDGLAAALQDRYTVLRYDSRGHGASGTPAGAYTFDQFTGDALGLLDALGVSRTHFLGLSMGGMIAQHLALAAPQRLDKLIVASSTSRMAPESGPIWEGRIAQAQAEGMAVLAPDTLRRWFTPRYRAEQPELMAHIAALVAATPVAGYVGCAQAIRRLDVTARLSAIAVPTLVIVGADDPGTPPAQSRAIAEAIPGARLEIVPAASHMVCIEQAAAFAALVADFLGN